MKYTVFFDLGNVLLLFDHHKMKQQVASCCHLSLQETEFLFQKHFDAYEKGFISTQALYSDLLGREKDISFTDFTHALSDIFQPNIPVITLLEKLKTRGIKLFILSNTCDAHFNFAKANFSFLKLFDGFVLSYEVGSRKPERKIYQKALELANCSIKKCFYIDDVPEFVQAALSCNIDSEVYSNPETLHHHLIQRGLL
jgi:glucose-1-phosphatase